VGVGLSAVQRVFVGDLAAVMDADLVLTFLVIMQVIWLPVGMVWGVLSLVRAVVAGVLSRKVWPEARAVTCGDQFGCDRCQSGISNDLVRRVRMMLVVPSNVVCRCRFEVTVVRLWLSA
jgi:hypothetical protein